MNVCCTHCWHLFTGPIWKVMRNGFIIQECCKCGEHRELHRDHAYEQNPYSHKRKKFFDEDSWPDYPRKQKYWCLAT